MEYLSEIFSWIFILLGSFLILVGSIGLIRLPDFWSRLHGASITDTGGVLFLLIGMMIQADSIWIFLKLVAIGIFLFVSSPTASHAIANAAYVTFGYNSKREAKK
jgi:multicomponent Na+:H+ antiporter subunit G